MIYDADTARGAKVYDVDTKKEICFVLSVDDTAGLVEVAEWPLRATEDECIASRRIRFSSVYAIKGSEPWPVLFHCYGRVSENAGNERDI